MKGIGFVFMIFLFFSACSNIGLGGRGTSSYPGIILDEEAYFLEKSREFAEELLEKYPEKDHLIIGWGMNTTGTMNALREIGVSDDYLWEIPITHMNKIKPDELEFSSEEALKILKERREDLFKKILPPIEKINGRKVVLHRALWAGKTFGEFVGAFVDYMKRNGYPLPLKTQVILDSDRQASSIAKKTFGPDSSGNQGKTFLSSLVEGEDYTFDYFKDSDYHQMIIDEVRDFGWDVRDGSELSPGQVYLIKMDERKKKGFLNNSKYRPQTAMDILLDKEWSGFKVRLQTNNSCNSLIGNFLN